MPAKAERDARRLAASGDYMRADYLLVSHARRRRPGVRPRRQALGPALLPHRPGPGDRLPRRQRLQHQDQPQPPLARRQRQRVAQPGADRQGAALVHRAVPPAELDAGHQQRLVRLRLCRGAAARHHAATTTTAAQCRACSTARAAASASISASPGASSASCASACCTLVERTTPDIVVSTLSGVDGPVTVRETRRAPRRRDRPARLRQLPAARLPPRRRSWSPAGAAAAARGLRSRLHAPRGVGHRPCAAGAAHAEPVRTRAAHRRRTARRARPLHARRLPPALGLPQRAARRQQRGVRRA